MQRSLHPSRGPGIYNTSLRSHHKTLMFINVNARDLCPDVVYMSLKGVLMRGGGAGGTDGQTNGGEHREGVKNEFPRDHFYSSVFLFFILCVAICHESCSSHVAYLQSINYGYLSFGHSQNCYFLLCQFVGTADDSLLC